MRESLEALPGRRIGVARADQIATGPHPDFTADMRRNDVVYQDNLGQLEERTRRRGFETALNNKGDLLIRKPGEQRWHNYNPPGWDRTDRGAVVGHVQRHGTEAVVVTAAIAAAPVTGGTSLAAVATTVGIGGAASALTETTRQGIGTVSGERQGMDGKRIAASGTAGAVGSLIPGTGPGAHALSDAIGRGVARAGSRAAAAGRAVGQGATDAAQGLGSLGMPKLAYANGAGRDGVVTLQVPVFNQGVSNASEPIRQQALTTAAREGANAAQPRNNQQVPDFDQRHAKALNERRAASGRAESGSQTGYGDLEGRIFERNWEARLGAGRTTPNMGADATGVDLTLDHGTAEMIGLRGISSSDALKRVRSAFSGKVSQAQGLDLPQSAAMYRSHVQHIDAVGAENIGRRDATRILGLESDAIQNGRFFPVQVKSSPEAALQFAREQVKFHGGIDIPIIVGSPGNRSGTLLMENKELLPKLGKDGFMVTSHPDRGYDQAALKELADYFAKHWRGSAVPATH